MRARWLATLLLVQSTALCAAIGGLQLRLRSASHTDALSARRSGGFDGLTMDLTARNSTRRPSAGAYGGRDKLPAGLSFAERMAAGGIARAVSMAVTYPLNAYKTHLNLNRSPQSLSAKQLLGGLDAQLALGLPVGALQMATVEGIRSRLRSIMPRKGMKMGTDFLSGALATTLCSVLSMPETVITHRLMAGTYPSLATAMRSIYKNEGIRGFYSGLVPTLAHQIPAQGLNWAFFEQFKRMFAKARQRAPSPFEGLAMASLASATSATLLAPLDTAKTRLIAHGSSPRSAPRSGVFSTLSNIYKQEGAKSLYKGLTPRLLSVVPLVAIQLGVYEAAKQQLLAFKRRRALNQMIADHEREVLAT